MEEGIGCGRGVGSRWVSIWLRKLAGTAKGCGAGMPGWADAGMSRGLAGEAEGRSDRGGFSVARA